MHDIGTLYVLVQSRQSLAKIGVTRNGTPDARATAYERPRHPLARLLVRR